VSSLILAVRFLTIVPVPGREAAGIGALGRAGWWFPVVGLALGGALVALDRALAVAFPALLASLLVVSAWKVATGGIHLDGLADCLDGLGGRTAEHSLSIMRDSRIGVFGAVGLILAFLIAVVALAELPPGARARALLLAPVVGRLTPLLVAPAFPAVAGGGGTAGVFLSGVSRWAGLVHLAAALGLAWVLLGAWGAAVVLGAALAALAWSGLFAWRLGGVTGDVLGGGVEIAELTVLLLAASLAFRMG
jgi:adenosylcobinamide-GDP ribazoletransferase